MVAAQPDEAVKTNGAVDPQSQSPAIEGSSSKTDTDANGPASAGDGQKSKNKKKKKKTGSKSTTGSANGSDVHPVSHIDELLPVPDGVQQHYFDPVKGKGLVAARDFKAGDFVFSDEAFVAAPPMAQARKVLVEGSLCDNCFQPSEGGVMGPIRCSTGSSSGKCAARWCGKECERRSREKGHGVLCPNTNPAMAPFMEFLTSHPYLSLHSVVRLYALLLVSHSSSPPQSIAKPGSASTLDENLSHIGAFATISELIRRRRNPGWDMEKRAFESTFKTALSLLKTGLDPWEQQRVTRGEQGGIRGKGKWLVDPGFPRRVSEELFSWDGFMRALGRANLNMESQGGMYCIHSHLNHSCSPNLRAHHPPSRRGMRQATKIALEATEDIPKGTELTITYQDPSLGVKRRNLLLWREHIFGPCPCARCEREVGELSEEERRSLVEFKPSDEDKQEVELRRKQADVLNKEAQAKQGGGEGGVNKGGEKDLSGLEEELRQTLGF